MLKHLVPILAFFVVAKLVKVTKQIGLHIVKADEGGYLHGERLEMVHGLQALRDEVLNEVLTAQTG